MVQATSVVVPSKFTPEAYLGIDRAVKTVYYSNYCAVESVMREPEL